jgi:hypothetical protein
MSEEKKRNKYPAPKPDAKDRAHAALRSALAAIPYGGGAAIELVSAIVTPSLERRKSEWMEQVGLGLSELEDHFEEFSVEHLLEDEEFVTALMHAVQSAIRNHHNEKRRALRNAVLNVAIGHKPEEDWQLLFLHFIDALTPWQVTLLPYFQNPRTYGEARGITYPDWSMGGPTQVLEHTFSELKNCRDFYDQLVKDMHARGLLSTDSLHITMTGQGMFQKATTEMGDKFVNFITSPIEGDIN